VTRTRFVSCRLLTLTSLITTLSIATVSAQNMSFNDSFEWSTLISYWKATQQSGTITQSTAQAYAGSHALKFASGSGGDLNVSLVHTFAV
jgi:hypothetical protein